ncbi:MAG: hypothetical protein ACFFCO_09480 [Promethearchaeota archaeon]
MPSLDFLKSRTLIRCYLLATIVILALSMVVNLLGFAGNPAIQALAGALSLVSIPLMIGVVLLNLHLVDRSTRVGWILIRFSYVTLVVASLCLLFIGLLSFQSSVLAGYGSTFGRQMATTAFVTQMTLSITVTTLSYYTLPIESVWSVNPLR